MHGITPSIRRLSWPGFIGLLGLLALLTACTETARPPYPDEGSTPPVPKISVGEFAGELAKGMPVNGRSLLTDALRAHLQERQLLWTDPANPRIDLAGQMQAYEGRYGSPPDESTVVDVTGELRDGSKLIASAAINRHVPPNADWNKELAAMAESLIDALMRKVAPPPPMGVYDNVGYGNGYPPAAYGGAYSAYPYYYPGAYYGYAVPPYGYYYGGPSYWWPYYYWGWGGRDHDHGHGGGYPGGGGGGHRGPPPPIPPAVSGGLPRTHGSFGTPPAGSGSGSGPLVSPPTGNLTPNRPSMPSGVFAPPRSHPATGMQAPALSAPPSAPQPASPGFFSAPSMAIPRSHGMDSRPSFSPPVSAPPVMRAPAMSAPSFSRPSAPSMPAPVFRPPSSGGGFGGGGMPHRRR